MRSMLRTQRGFTLMELIVAVAIIGILAAIAVPNYTAYIDRGKRAAAKTVLLDAANQLERNYTTNGCYNFTTVAECRAQAGNAPVLPTGAPQEGRAAYGIAVNYPTGQQFTLSAVPCGASGANCAAGSEAFTDADCGSLTLTHTGARGITGTGTVANCWQR